METTTDIGKLMEGVVQLLNQQQSLMEAIQQQTPTGSQLAGLLQQQQQLLQTMQEGRALGDLKLEGMKLPRFRGDENESFALYQRKCVQYFEARRIDINNKKLAPQLLAILGSTLDGAAGQMWVERSELIDSVKDFFITLHEEFVPHDLQRRLRRQLKDLKQRDCRNIADYISKFRHIILQVTEMTEVDKMTHFLDGLQLEVSEEVDFANPRNLKDAIKIALNYDRSHRRRQPRRPVPVQDTAEPMEIDYVQSTRPKNGCWNCGKLGHKAVNCRAPQQHKGKRFGNSNGNQQNKRFGHQQNNRQGQNRNHQNNNRRPNKRGQNVHFVEEVQAAEEAQEETIVFDEFTVNGVEVAHLSDEETAGQLLRKQATINDREVTVLLDCGASTNLIRPGLVENVIKVRDVEIEGYDGTRKKMLNQKTVEASIELEGCQFDNLRFTECEMSTRQDVILGKPWFAQYEPQVNWRTNEVSFPETVQRVTSAKVTPDPPQAKEEIRKRHQSHLMLAEAWRNGVFGSVKKFQRRMKDKRFAELFFVKVVSAVEASDIPKFIRPVVEKYADCFPEKLPEGLPPRRTVEFETELKPDATPSTSPPFRLSKTEQEALDLFIQENLKKGWIEVSNSPWVSNIFGIPKKDPKTGKAPSRGEWLRSGNSTVPIRWVIDFRYVNSRTKIPKIPLPLIEEIFDKMAGCVVFTVIDLAQGYHQMRVKLSSRQYTAFRSHRETYQWCVAPMGLAGMPGVWSRLMRVLFDKFEFVVVYLDDICIFSKSEEEHVQHLARVFEVLRREKLYALRSKCSFGKASVDFLGHTVSAEGLSVDKRKTTAIEHYPEPTNKKELLSFLGLAGYYRRFICDFAQHALPLSKLTKKQAEWEWGPDQAEAFRTLKLALQQAPVLKLPDFTTPFVVTTDASGKCMGGVLSQRSRGQDHPIAFYSKKLSKHEEGWPPHEQELLAIKTALAKWRHYLHGRHFDVFTDNAACSWMLNHPQVSLKMARMLTFFSQFNFTMHHVKGQLNVVADALSRPSKPPMHDETDNDVMSDDSMAEALQLPQVHECTADCDHMATKLRRHSAHAAMLRLLPERDRRLLLEDLHLRGRSHSVGIAHEVHHVVLQIQNIEYSTSRIRLSEEQKQRFQHGYARDPFFKNEWNGNSDSGMFEKKNDLLYKKTEHAVARLCVPKDERLITSILQEFHDSPTAAHPGIRRTQLRIAQWYYWHTLEKDVKEYVSSCGTCARWKVSNSKKKGKLMPIPIPEECWEVVTMDFVTGLPVSEGFDAIMTVVDKLSKRAKYYPTHTTADAPETARVFFDAVVRHHGLPKTIISDRDSKFTSKFWSSLMNIMGVKLAMTTSHRPQADGQTERQNLVLEDALRCMVSYHGQDWVSHLGTIEYAHATMISTSTNMTPFELDTGRKVRNAVVQDFGSTLSEEVPIADFAKQFAAQRQKIIELARKNLLAAQERQKKYYDRKRRTVEFKEGDYVLLDTRNLPLKRITEQTGDTKEKLAARHIGPFQIEKMINSNVARLKLPTYLSRLHPSFNVEFLEHSVDNPDKFASRPLPKTAPVLLEDDTEQELHFPEALLKRMQRNNKRLFLVKWHGLPDSDNSWEYEDKLRKVSHWRELLRTFNANRQGD